VKEASGEPNFYSLHKKKREIWGEKSEKTNRGFSLGTCVLLGEKGGNCVRRGGKKTLCASGVPCQVGRTGKIHLVGNIWRGEKLKGGGVGQVQTVGAGKIEREGEGCTVSTIW